MNSNSNELMTDEGVWGSGLGLGEIILSLHLPIDKGNKHVEFGPRGFLFLGA
jgi:hypothetical protein